MFSAPTRPGSAPPGSRPRREISPLKRSQSDTIIYANELNALLKTLAAKGYCIDGSIRNEVLQNLISNKLVNVASLIALIPNQVPKQFERIVEGFLFKSKEDIIVYYSNNFSIDIKKLQPINQTTELYETFGLDSKVPFCSQFITLVFQLKKEKLKLDMSFLQTEKLEKLVDYAIENNIVEANQGEKFQRILPQLLANKLAGIYKDFDKKELKLLKLYLSFTQDETNTKELTSSTESLPDLERLSTTASSGSMPSLESMPSNSVAGSLLKFGTSAIHTTPCPGQGVAPDSPNSYDESLIFLMEI